MVILRSSSSDTALSSINPAPIFDRRELWERPFGVVLLILALPIILLLVLIVRLTSRGSGLYRQIRVGKYGRIFVMYKIRTMVHDAEATTGPTWAANDDPRITPVGHVLRKYHLDELPQLLNVVRGEMALMGPRPERPELVHALEERIPGYLNRLAVLPGISGLAQINLPPDTDLNSVRRKLKLDIEYIETATLALHVRMFLWTGLRLFAIPCSIATPLLRLGRSVSLSGELLCGDMTIDHIIETKNARINRPIAVCHFPAFEHTELLPAGISN